MESSSFKSNVNVSASTALLPAAPAGEADGEGVVDGLGVAEL